MKNKRKLFTFKQKVTEGASQMNSSILNSPTLLVILGTLCTLYAHRSAEVVYSGHQRVTQCCSVVIRHPEFSTTIIYMLRLYHGPGVNSAPSENEYHEHSWG